MTAINKVFVYGTLRSAATNPCENYGGKLVGSATFKGAKLFDLGWYPGITLDSSDSILHGDVYEIDQSIIPRLDAYEGAPNLYQRRVVNVEGHGDVYIYEYNGYPHNREIIESGDWLVHNNKSPINAG